MCPIGNPISHSTKRGFKRRHFGQQVCPSIDVAWAWGPLEACDVRFGVFLSASDGEFVSWELWDVGVVQLAAASLIFGPMNPLLYVLVLASGAGHIRLDMVNLSPKPLFPHFCLYFCLRSFQFSTFSESFITPASGVGQDVEPFPSMGRSNF